MSLDAPLPPNVEAGLVRKLVDRALQGAEDETATEQIALYEGAAIALRQVDHTAAAVAAYTAHLKRETERHQLKFRELLKS